jgi:hypothetical protein
MALLLREDMDEDEDTESLEVVDDVLELDWSGSAPGRWAAAVCSWRRREASTGLDIDSSGVWRKASSGLVGSAKVEAE